MPAFTVDPEAVFREIIGPFGGYVLLIIFFCGFGLSKPWFYFSREVKQKDDRIKYLEGQNVTLLTMIRTSGVQTTRAVDQATQVAKLLKEMSDMQPAEST